VASGISEAPLYDRAGVAGCGSRLCGCSTTFTGKVDGFIVEMDNSASELVDYFIKNRTKQLKP
jgi:hypothetical protein